MPLGMCNMHHKVSAENKRHFKNALVWVVAPKVPATLNSQYNNANFETICSYANEVHFLE